MTQNRFRFLRTCSTENVVDEDCVQFHSGLKRVYYALTVLW